MRECNFEVRQRRYCAVTVGAVAAVASTAYGAYSASQSKKDALNYQAGHAPQAVPYQPVLANYNPSAGIQYYLDNFGNYNGQLNNAAGQLNQQYQSQIGNLTPQLLPSLRSASRSSAALTRGEIPADVQAQIARSAAQQALSGGYGGSQMAGNLTARDLGRTSLDLQQQGLQNTASILGMDQRLVPVSAYQFLGDPSQQAARYDAFAGFNAKELTDAAKNNAGVQTQNNATDYYAGLAGLNASAINPGGAALASGVGALAAYAGNRGAPNYAYAYGPYNGDNRLGQNYQGTIDWSKIDWSNLNAPLNNSGSGQFGYTG